MRKLLYLIPLLSLLFVLAPVSADACTELIAHECYNQEEKCEFTVTTTANHDLRAQGGDYGELDKASRNWYDLREVTSAYDESGSTMKEYESCNTDKCDIMPIGFMRMRAITTTQIKWADWNSGRYGWNLQGFDKTGDSGCMRIKAKNGFLVKLKFGFAPEEEDENDNPDMIDFLLRGSYSIQSDYDNDRNPWVTYSSQSPTAAGYTHATVILDGDNGDYLSMDPSDDCSDIGTFTLDMSKPDGTNWVYSTTYGDHDYNNDQEKWFVNLMGYENKEYLRLRAECDQIEATEEAELDTGATVSTITLEVNEGDEIALSADAFSGDTHEIKLYKPQSPYLGISNNNKPKVKGWSEDTRFGFSLGYNLKDKENIDDIILSAINVNVFTDTPYNLIKYAANRNTEHGVSEFSNILQWIKLTVKDTNVAITVNADATKDFNSPENTLPTANKLVLDLENIPPNGESICTDPDSDIIYSNLEVLSGGDLISTARIYQNKLSFYKVLHKQGNVRLKFKCDESHYNNQEEVTINIELTNVVEDISVVGATPAIGYELGKTTFSIDEETDETFSISLINYDDNTISVGQGTSTQFTSNNGISVNVRPVGKNRIDLDYSAGSPEDDYLILPIVEGNKDPKNLKINFVVNDINSPIKWKVEEIALETQEEFSKSITKTTFINKYEDSEGDSIGYISFVDLAGVTHGELSWNNLPISTSVPVPWNSLNNNPIVYTPSQNAVGSDSFWIKVTDDNSEGVLVSQPLKVTIDITNTNDNPTISFPVEYTLTNGKYILEIEEDSFGSAIVSPSDIDEGDNPTIKVSPPSNSQWSNSDISITNNKITFTPPADFFDESGTIMEVRASDGKLESNPIQIIVKVSGVNDLPTSAAKEVSTYRDTKYTFKPSEFQFSDVDSGDTLQKVTITNLPSGGDLKLSGSEVSTDDVIIAAELTNLAFYPNFGFVNTTSFSFSVSDGTDYSDTNILSIKVLPSPYGDFSQSCSLGGEKILNSNWCCKTGYTPKPDLTDVTIAGGDVNACKPYQNLPPVASFIASSTNISIGDIVLFNASASQDSDGAIVEYSWDFGDNSTKGTGKTTSHKYTSECNDDPCQVTLTVKDNLNQLSTDSIIINLGAAATIPLVDNTTDETIPTLPDTGDDPELTAAQKELVEQQRELAALQKQLQQQDDSGGAGWFLALLILALLGGGGWYAFKKGLFGKKKPPATIPASTPTTSTQPTTSPIRNFISTNKQKGLSNEEIRTKLRGKGWRDGDIDKYMNAART